MRLTSNFYRSHYSPAAHWIAYEGVLLFSSHAGKNIAALDIYYDQMSYTVLNQFKTMGDSSLLSES